MLHVYKRKCSFTVLQNLDVIVQIANPNKSKPAGTYYGYGISMHSFCIPLMDEVTNLVTLHIRICQKVIQSSFLG